MTILPSLSIQATYQCNISCKHCGPNCAPEENDWMTPDEIRDLIRQGAELGTTTVVFTGGEPSLLREELPRIVRFTHEQGIINSRVVTNAKFGSSYNKAKRILGSWIEAGLVELNLSCGEFHQEFIPLEHVANAYRAADDLGFKTVLLAGEFLAPGKGRYEAEDFRAAMEEQCGGPLPSIPLASPYTD